MRLYSKAELYSTCKLILTSNITSFNVIQMFDKQNIIKYIMGLFPDKNSKVLFIPATAVSYRHNSENDTLCSTLLNKLSPSFFL